MKRFLVTIGSAASGLATVIGRETGKYYVSAGIERPWTAEDDADFLAFCETIDVPPTYPELAAAMADGDLDFLNIDIWTRLHLYRS